MRRKALARAILLAALCTLALGLAGCERLVRSMYDQPHLLPGQGSPLFPDGKASRPPPPGSVPRSMGEAAFTSSGRRGTAEVAERERAEAAAAQPTAVTAQLLARGQLRYTIYCTPCHGPAGDGDGQIVRRGFPAPPSFHTDRLRAAGDRHVVDVIAQGYGIMVPYADRVTPEDRWAIAAYIRALQLSQHADVATLPAALRARVEAAGAPAPAASAGAWGPAGDDPKGPA